MRDVVIVAAARTPIGSFLSSLAAVSATELGGIAIRAALERSTLAASDIEEVFMGCVLPAGLGQAPARQAALAGGLPQAVPCTTVNKVCGSGLKSVVLAAQAIACSDVDVAVAGGMESMSQAPHLQKGVRGGVKMGAIESIDSMVHEETHRIHPRMRERTVRATTKQKLRTMSPESKRRLRGRYR